MSGQEKYAAALIAKMEWHIAQAREISRLLVDMSVHDYTEDEPEEGAETQDEPEDDLADPKLPINTGLWSKDDDLLLTTMWHDGLAPSVIAKELNRKVGAIYARRAALKLPTRKTPSFHKPKENNE